MDGPSVSLTLSGDVLTVDEFVRAAQSLLRVLKEVDRELSGAITSEWTVQELSKSSPARLATRPEIIKSNAPDNRVRIVQIFDSGLRSILKQAVRPPYFNDQALRGARELTQLLGRDVHRISVTSVTNGEPRQAIHLNKHLVANVDELINPLYSYHGSVEGRLEVISVHNQDSFWVYEDLSNRRVVCYCTRTELAEIDGQDLGRRVVVSGLVRTNKSGAALSVRVKSYRFLSYAPDLPTPDDITGLMKGVSVKDHGEYLKDKDGR